MLTYFRFGKVTWAPLPPLMTVCPVSFLLVVSSFYLFFPVLYSLY